MEKSGSYYETKKKAFMYLRISLEKVMADPETKEIQLRSYFYNWVKEYGFSKKSFIEYVNLIIDKKDEFTYEDAEFILVRKGSND